LQQISNTFALFRSTKLPEINEKCDPKLSASETESEDEQPLTKKPILRHLDDDTFSDSELDQRQDCVSSTAVQKTSKILLVNSDQGMGVGQVSNREVDQKRRASITKLLELAQLAH
jgi:hypothetical protein